MYKMKKIGILGGGQLGRMLLQEGANYPAETFVMENDPNCPAAHLCHHFVKGDIRNYDDVFSFGQKVDIITIEIESVNVDALEALETLGKVVIPKPSVLRTINNKITQKAFYAEHAIPSPAYIVTNNLAELQQQIGWLPAVHKIAQGGYDGRGVQLLKSSADLTKGFDAPSVLEKMVDIKMEIAVTVAVGLDGSRVLYPAVEMIFDPYLNLLDYQVCPAQLDQKLTWKAEAIALQVAKSFNGPGLFAVEMLVDRQQNIWVNETAPRVHNSGHHTIEAHKTSQYDMVWRILLGYPLGSTEALTASALVNLIGAEGHSGQVAYDGIEKLLNMDNVYVHLYGKEITKPGRKMGHVTILGSDRLACIMKSRLVKETASVISKA
jgi:5-(carboxyamino)imidazole ribonucleotide synthase